MSSETTLHLRSYLEIINRLSYACGKQRKWDSKKAPTKCIIHSQAGNYFFDGKKKRTVKATYHHF